MHCVTLFNLLNLNILKKIVLIHALREDPLYDPMVIELNLINITGTILRGKISDVGKKINQAIYS